MNNDNQIYIEVEDELVKEIICLLRMRNKKLLNLRHLFGPPLATHTLHMRISTRDSHIPEKLRHMTTSCLQVM